VYGLSTNGMSGVPFHAGVLFRDAKTIDKRRLQLNLRDVSRYLRRKQVAGAACTEYFRRQGEEAAKIATARWRQRDEVSF